MRRKPRRKENKLLKDSSELTNITPSAPTVRPSSGPGNKESPPPPSSMSLVINQPPRLWCYPVVVGGDSPLHTHIVRLSPQGGVSARWGELENKKW